jgi:hypothetical protein
MRQFYPWMLDEFLGNPAMLDVLIVNTDIKTLFATTSTLHHGNINTLK